MSSKLKVLYACPICRDSYDTFDEAQACLSQPFDIGRWKVGDLVLCPGKWHGWYEKTQEHWLACTAPVLHKGESDWHFDWIPHYFAWFVVLEVGGRRDRNRPHRSTTVVGTRLYGTLIGWTPTNGKGHYTLYGTPEEANLDFSWRMPAVTEPSKELLQARDLMVDRYDRDAQVLLL